MDDEIAPKQKRRINSRAKGARGERMFRDQLREAGYEARRGQQFAGGTDSPDVICEALSFIHFEVKCVQNLNLDKVMTEQAEPDAGHKMPVVAHKKDGKPWRVTCNLTDFLILITNSDHPQLSSIYVRK